MATLGLVPHCDMGWAWPEHSLSLEWGTHAAKWLSATQQLCGDKLKLSVQGPTRSGILQKTME